MSQQSLSPESVNPKSAKSNCKRSIFPGRIMKVDMNNKSLSWDTTSDCQNPMMPQTCLNSSSEVRSRKKSVPLQRHSSDSVVNEQLELVDVNLSSATGHGHRFISANLSQPTWCDKCGDFIWGVYKQCLICTSMLALFLYSTFTRYFSSVTVTCTKNTF